MSAPHKVSLALDRAPQVVIDLRVQHVVAAQLDVSCVVHLVVPTLAVCVAGQEKVEHSAFALQHAVSNSAAVYVAGVFVPAAATLGSTTEPDTQVVVLAILMMPLQSEQVASVLGVQQAAFSAAVSAAPSPLVSYRVSAFAASLK